MPISATGSYIRKDQIFPASRDGTATYVDHDENGRQVLRTEVKHLRGEIPMDPKDIPEERQFDSRDDMLYHIANERLKANRDAYNRGKISLSERYSLFSMGGNLHQGFDGGLLRRITRPVRIFMPKQNGVIKGLLEGIDTISDEVTLSKDTKKKLGLFGKALNVPLKVFSIAIKVTNFALKALDLTARTLWAGVRAVEFLAIDVRKQGWKKAIDKKFIEWDRKLLKNPKTKAWVNYSVKDVRDFIVRPQIFTIKDHSKTYTKSTWHHNGESNYSFINENGEREVLKNTVVSSNDRTAKKISMMRCVDDITTGESISYTGRADTRSKIEEQLNFLFQSEFSKKKEHQKGLEKTESGYDMTFMVNNLMSSNAFGTMGLTGLTGLDERASVQTEMELFMALAKEGPIELKDKDGNVHRVNIKPLYFNQGFNYIAVTYGTPETQKEINTEGYKTLLPMIQDAIDHNEKLSSKDQNLLEACYKHLENRGSLDPEVELFYRDLSMKLLKIPVINHCKSSIDRTTLALAIATSTQSWINLGKEIPLDNPHKIMSDPLYKELFIANVQGSHQATRASRASEGEINGHQQFSRALGFEWGSKGKGLKGKFVSLFQGQNPIAIRLLPDRYLDKSNKNLNEESPLIKDRFLKKPKKMKMFYQNDNPHIVKLQEDLRREAEERQEFRTQRVFNTLMRRVAQAA